MMFDSFEAYDVQETRRVSRKEGEQLYLIKQIIKKIIKNISVSQIATDLLEPLDTIQPILWPCHKAGTWFWCWENFESTDFTQYFYCN